MAENENVQNPEAQQPQAQPEQDDQPVFQLQRCYLKDASLEMPHAPDILLTPQESAPQVDIQFEVSQRLVQADLYDITVRGTITVKAPEDKVIILAEGRQSGIFSIHGIPAEPLPVDGLSLSSCQSGGSDDPCRRSAGSSPGGELRGALSAASRSGSGRSACCC